MTAVLLTSADLPPRTLHPAMVAVVQRMTDASLVLFITGADVDDAMRDAAAAEYERRASAPR